MTRQFATLEKEITNALSTLGSGVESSSKGKWRWYPDDSGKAPVEVRLEDEWLTCQLQVPSPSSEEELWWRVERRSLLDGVCRVIVEPRDNTFHIRQDMPVTENGDFAVACRRALEAMASARRKHFPSNGGGEAAAGESAAEKAGVADGTIRDACIEAGWSWCEREGSRPSVDIELPQGSRKVGVETFPGKGCRLSVSLARYKSLNGTSRVAVAAFLLTANGVVRFARAGVEEREKGVEAFYEVWIDERPTPAVIGHALASLSVGCRLCERELQVLGDENVARMFLEVRGSLVGPGDRSPRKRPPALQG